jgi:hypothetical protein
MAGLLLRVGGLLLVGDLLYLAAWEAFRGGVDSGIFRMVLKASAVCFAGSGALWALSRVWAGISVRACARCGRRIARGRVYCDDHRVEAINKYRDLERGRHD